MKPGPKDIKARILITYKDGEYPAKGTPEFEITETLREKLKQLYADTLERSGS